MQKHWNIICPPISYFVHHHVPLGTPYVPLYGVVCSNFQLCAIFHVFGDASAPGNVWSTVSVFLFPLRWVEGTVWPSLPLSLSPLGSPATARTPVCQAEGVQGAVGEGREVEQARGAWVGPLRLVGDPTLLLPTPYSSQQQPLAPQAFAPPIRRTTPSGPSSLRVRLPLATRV